MNFRDDWRFRGAHTSHTSMKHGRLPSLSEQASKDGLSGMSENFDQLVALAEENGRLREAIKRLRKIIAEASKRLDKQEAEKLLKEALVFGGDLEL